MFHDNMVQHGKEATHSTRTGGFADREAAGRLSCQHLHHYSFWCPFTLQGPHEWLLEGQNSNGLGQQTYTEPQSHLKPSLGSAFLLHELISCSHPKLGLFWGTS